MKEKLVFEYSWEAKKFNNDNPNNRKFLELIYDKGVDNFEILATVTDNNTISDDFSRQLTYLFKLIEINKSYFFDYCSILQYKKEFQILIPEDEKIVNDKKRLSEYWNKEAFVQVCPKLIQKLLELDVFNASLKVINNFTKLFARNENNYWGFPIWIDNNIYENLFKGDNALDKLKFTALGEDLFSFPRTLIMETFVPACAVRFADDEKRFKDQNKNAFEHPEKTLNLINYIVLLV